ncbi:glutamine amidotransferase subunit pdxT [Paraphysoderma sedebokerense]|nr:glutamine amidotransferase subunit pdxT [Paraphysoderma sedebokerense]
MAANNSVNPLPVKIGVLALQGAFNEHINIFNRLPNVKAITVKTKSELFDSNIDGLVIPGGESTTMAIVAERMGLFEELRSWVNKEKERRAIWGTCAGLILLSKTAHRTKLNGQPLLGALDITCLRNAFGPQTASFTTHLNIPTLTLNSSNSPDLSSSNRPFPGVFIRAPIVESISSEVEILCSLADHKTDQESCTDSDKQPIGDKVVAVKQGNVIGTSFHPELTQDDRFHVYFVEMVRKLKLEREMQGAR